MPLSPEDQAVLESLVDPDASESRASNQYAWDEEFQRNILGMLLCDRFFLIQSQGLVEPDYFSDEVHRMISRLLFGHFNQYRRLPSKIQLRQELNEQISEKPPEVRIHYLGELNTVYEYYFPGVDARDYLRDKITNFAKKQALQNSFVKCLEEIKKDPESENTWAKVQNILKEAMAVDRNFEIGLEYFQTFEERYARKQEESEAKELFTSGFKTIDHALLGGGLSRGEMASWMGLSGTGKSLALVTATVANMNQGKRVLYISTEMNEDKIAERFDAQLADPRALHGVSINNLDQKKDIVFEALRDYIADKADPRLLVVKQFPAGQMDVATFRAYFSQLQQYDFHPDLVVIDYIGEMKDFPGVKTYESRYMIVRDLRGFATEENVCVMTAMQPNRSAKEAVKLGQVIGDENLGDSYAQVRPLDALWSINQTKDEKDCGIARIWIEKHRHGESKKLFYVEYRPTLEISEISAEQYNTRLKKYLHEKKDIVRDETSSEFACDVLEKGEKNKITNMRKAFDDPADSSDDQYEEGD